MGQDAGLIDHAVLDLLPEAVLVLDAEYAIAHFNDRAQVLLEIDDHAVGADVTTVVDVRDDAGGAGADWLPRPGPVVGNRLAERVLWMALPDGRTRALSMAGRFLEDGGLVLTFRSAGRRVRLDAARSGLIATVSHELRSPLTSVKGFTSTMLRRWDRFSDEQKQAMLETINHDADRVTRLLKELLEVSRIDAGRVQMNRQRVDLVAIVEGIVDRARHHDDGARRDLVFTIGQPPPRVLVDADKLEQVFSNLIENALKYAPDSQVRVHLTADDDAVQVAVADDGPGIPADQTRRIFEKFGRGKDQRPTGTGLGLYITRGLVQAHGGRVWCDSQTGQGAVFHVVVPLGS